MAIKVSQATIDKIKKMGMTKALASAKSNRSPEWQEALRRMYGQRRLTKALGGATPSSSAKQMSAAMESPRAKAAKKTVVSKGLTPAQKRAKEGGLPSARQKEQMRNRNVAGATAAAAAAGGYLAKAKSVQKKVANMTPAQKKAYMTKMKNRGASLSKFAKSPAGKAIGLGSRLTAAGAPILVGQGILKASDKLKKQVSKTPTGMKAVKRYEKSGGPASARTRAMAESIKKNKRK